MDTIGKPQYAWVLLTCSFILFGAGICVISFDEFFNPNPLCEVFCIIGEILLVIDVLVLFLLAIVTMRDITHGVIHIRRQ